MTDWLIFAFSIGFVLGGFVTTLIHDWMAKHRLLDCSIVDAKEREG